MTTLTLCVKAYHGRQLEHVESLLEARLEGLRVNIRMTDATSRDWMRVELSGEDERVAASFLAKEVGLCSTNLEALRKFSTVRARIATLGKSRDSLLLDAGICEPEIVGITFLWCF